MEMRRVLIVGLLLVGACTSNGSAPEGTSPSGSPTLPTPSPPARVFVRTCDSSVYGRLPQGWRRDALVVGPVAFWDLPGYARAPARTFHRRQGEYVGLKALAVVEAGPSVTVRVRRSDLGHVTLLYDPASFQTTGSYRVSDGQSAVRFVPCKADQSPFGGFGSGGHATQLNGGFIVAGARCAALEISFDRQPPKRVWVSFGKGRQCP